MLCTLGQLYADCSLPSKDSIRLLQVNQAFPSPILSIRAYELESAPEYYALSYTWGNPLPLIAEDSGKYGRREVSILNSESSACQIEVSRNLFEAMCSLIEKGISGPIWIDAICINQADVEERNQQVSKMGNIYASAYEVIIWLGVSSELDEDAVALYNEFVPALRNHFNGSPPDNYLSLEQLIALKLLKHPQALTALGVFRRRAWFDRAWTFQEALLARRMTVYYGSDTISWDCILDFDRYATKFDNSVWKEISGPGGFLGLTQLHKLEGYRAENFHDKWKYEYGPDKAEGDILRSYILHDFVGEIRQRRSSDPRDQVFAAIGLVNYLFTPMCDDLGFSVQYNEPVESIFTSFTIWLLQRRPLQEILSMVEDPSKRQLQSLASWVPDLSVKAGLGHKRGTPLYVEPRLNPNASEDHRLSLEVDRKATLHVTGTRIGTICQVDDVPLTDPEQWGRHYYQILDDFCERMDVTYPSGETRAHALLKLLMLNTNTDEFDQKSFLSTFDWVRLNLIALEVLHSIQGGLDSLPTGNSDDILKLVKEKTAELYSSIFGLIGATTISIDHDLLPCQDRINHRVIQCLKEGISTQSQILQSKEHNLSQFLLAAHMQSRRLVQTKEGWIGLATRSTQIGDEVWKFKSSQVLYTLRPHIEITDAWTYGGTIYIYGVDSNEGPCDGECTEVRLI